MTADALFAPLAEVLRFPSRGQDWQGRFVVGAGLLFVSIFIPILPALVASGYLLQIVRAAMEGRELDLPAWTDWGSLFMDGLKVTVVGASYLLPGILVVMLGACLYCASIIPLSILSGSGTSANAEGLVALLLPLVMLIFFLSMAVGSILTFLGAVPLPVAAAQMARTSELGPAYRLHQVGRLIAANPMDYLVAWVVLLGLWTLEYALAMVAYYTLVLACLIPLILAPLSFYALAVGAALFGSAYRRSLQALDLPLPKAD
jgi:hypothetical protein